MADISKLNYYVQILCKNFLAKCKANGLDVIITQSLRTFAEQNALYDQGRKKPGKIVTNARGGDSMHNYGLAFDIAVKVNGEVTWEHPELYAKAGQIGKSVGLEWGGDFKSIKDTPHFQWTGGLSIKDLKAGKRPKTPSNYVKPVNPAPKTVVKEKRYIVTANILNVRTGPGTNYPATSTIRKGAQIIATKFSNGYAYFSGGWVDIKFLKGI